MPRSLADRIFLHPRYTSRAEIGQMRLLVATGLIMAILQSIPLTGLSGTFPSFQRAADGELLDLFVITTLYGFTALTLIAARAGQTRLAGFSLMAIWFFSSFMVSVVAGFVTRASFLSPVALILLGFIALRELGLAISAPLALAGYFIGLTQRTADALSAIPPANAVQAETTNLTVFIIGSTLILLIYLRNNRLMQIEQTAVAEDARLRLATITTEIAQRIASKTALSEVLDATIEEIRSRYREIYHAQIFLIDEFGSTARLVASTGEVGQLLLARGHGLEVGSVSVIGRVTQSGTAVVARAGSSDTVHKRNELLPDTVVEAAFPLIMENRVIGALDLQSRDITAFADQDLPIFQSLADNTAVAIENARLYEQTQSRLRENQRLLDQMRGAMREIERLNRQLTGRSWADYLESYDSNPNIEIDLNTDRLVRGVAATRTLQQAMQNDSSIQESRPEGAVIAIPIRVRGQVIGAMEFELTEEEPTIESVDLAQTVGERFGLALENTRLYEATQRVAQREQRVNAIAAQYQNVTTVDELLRITVAEIGDLLGAERASIRLGTIGSLERVSSGVVQPLRPVSPGESVRQNGGNGRHEGDAR